MASKSVIITTVICTSVPKLREHQLVESYEQALYFEPWSMGPAKCLCSGMLCTIAESELLLQ